MIIPEIIVTIHINKDTTIPERKLFRLKTVDFDNLAS